MGYFDTFTDTRHLLKNRMPYDIAIGFILFLVFVSFYPKYGHAEDWPRPFYVSIVQSLLFIGLAWFYPFTPFHYTVISFILAFPTLLLPFMGSYCHEDAI